MKLHRIRDTKNPTIQQLTKMCRNLRKVYPKSYVCISPRVMFYSVSPPESKRIDYWFDVEGVFHKNLSSWMDVLFTYRKLMRKGTKYGK